MDLFAKRNPEKGRRTQQIKAQIIELLELEQGSNRHGDRVELPG
jgi:hypothetical protein